MRKLFGLGIIDLNMMVTPMNQTLGGGFRYFHILSMFAAIWENDPT